MLPPCLGCVFLAPPARIGAWFPPSPRPAGGALCRIPPPWWVHLPSSRRPAESVTSAFLPPPLPAHDFLLPPLSGAPAVRVTVGAVRSPSVAGLGLHGRSRSGMFLNMYPHSQMSWVYGYSPLHPLAGQSAETGMSCEGSRMSTGSLLSRSPFLLPWRYKKGGKDPECPARTRFIDRASETCSSGGGSGARAVAVAMHCVFLEFLTKGDGTLVFFPPLLLHAVPQAMTAAASNTGIDAEQRRRGAWQLQE
ncbi:uncharacterized protein RG961_006677 [Leptosomus discolor]